MLLLVPVMLFVFGMMLLHAPRVFATAYDSLGLRWDRVTGAFGAGQAGTGLGNLLQCAALVLPGLGMVVSTGRVGKRVGSGAMSWSAGSGFRRAIVLGGTAASVALAAYTWWPNGDYRPIQKNERGTVQGGVDSLGAIPSGRPSLTPQRARQLHGAPFESKAPNLKRQAGKSRAEQLRARRQAEARSRAQGTNTVQVPSTTTSPTDTTPAPTDTTSTPTDTTTTPTDTTTSTATTPTDTTTSTTPTDTTTSPTPTDTTTSTTP
jgi:hypothetical protein